MQWVFVPRVLRLLRMPTDEHHLEVTTQLVHSTSTARKVQAMHSHGVDLDGYPPIKRAMNWVKANLRELIDAFLTIWIRVRNST